MANIHIVVDAGDLTAEEVVNMLDDAILTNQEAGTESGWLELPIIQVFKEKE